MLFLLFAVLALDARADEAETLTYQLTAAGQPVGERTLTVHYLESEAGEVRLLESYTELSVTVGRTTFEFRQRLGGQGRDPAGTFTSTIAQSDGRREIQAVRREEGWRVTVVEPSRVTTTEYGHRELDGTSLTLIDPGVPDFFRDRTRLRLLTAETGQILEGEVSPAGQVILNLDGQSVSGDAWIWRTAAGEMELVYGEAGHLLRYTAQVAGVPVQALLTAAPEARSYGETFELGPIGGSSIREENL